MHINLPPIFLMRSARGDSWACAEDKPSGDNNIIKATRSEARLLVMTFTKSGDWRKISGYGMGVGRLRRAAEDHHEAPVR